MGAGSGSRKLTFWSDVAICNISAPDAPVHSEQERLAELLSMADAFRELWKERAQAAPKLDLISTMAHSSGTRDMAKMEFVGNLALLIVGGRTCSASANSFNERGPPNTSTESAESCAGPIPELRSCARTLRSK